MLNYFRLGILVTNTFVGCGRAEPQFVQSQPAPQVIVGPQGTAGKDGINGIDGSQGAQGPAGTNGQAGAGGSEGGMGPAGPIGSQGPVGPQGTTGTTGATGETGSQGPQGTAGKDGVNGTSIVLDYITLEVQFGRENTAPVLYEGSVFLPSYFEISGISNTNGSGWIDFRIGDTILCYQRSSKSRRYEYKYKKALGAVQGCDSDNEKETSYVFFNWVSIYEGDSIEVIPRDIRLTGVNPIFNFPTTVTK